MRSMFGLAVPVPTPRVAQQALRLRRECRSLDEGAVQARVGSARPQDTRRRSQCAPVGCRSARIGRSGKTLGAQTSRGVRIPPPPLPRSPLGSRCERANRISGSSYSQRVAHSCGGGTLRSGNGETGEGEGMLGMLYAGVATVALVGLTTSLGVAVFAAAVAAVFLAFVWATTPIPQARHASDVAAQATQDSSTGPSDESERAA
jgi:hypothetical protein